MWREGGRRRSQRISALDESKSMPRKRAREPPHSHMDMRQQDYDAAAATKIVKGPASRTMSRSTRNNNTIKNKKLKSPVNRPPRSNSPSLNDSKGEEEPKNERDAPKKRRLIKQELDSTSKRHNVDNVSASWIPEKHTLQLILDKLQREDFHEIFAEPVNPEQVADYLAVIKEPMDFGTMRAKLHEGMYKSLEEFERDVFLIPQNAMRFNSSGTIFFKQAREIDDLAKKVFHLLKTDPRKFESELSETRQRASKRIRGKFKVSAHSQNHRHATPKSGGTTYQEVSSKSKPSPFSKFSSNTSGGATAGYFPTATPSRSRDHDILTPPEDARRFGNPKVYRRQTYRQENASTFSGINSKLLIHVNLQHNGYMESLMLFVKNLGPTAKRVATEKLNGLSTSSPSSQNSISDFSSHAQISQSPEVSDFMPQGLQIPDTYVMTQLSRPLLSIPCQPTTALEKIAGKTSYSKGPKDQQAQNSNFIVVSGLLATKTHKSFAKNNHGSSRELYSSKEMSIVHDSVGYEGNQNQSLRSQLQSSSSDKTARNLTVSREEIRRMDVVDPYGKGAINSNPSSASQITHLNQAITQVPHFGINNASSPQVTFNLPSIPQITHYAYDISYLRRMLNQAMNPLENSNNNNKNNNNELSLQQEPYEEGDLLDEMSNERGLIIRNQGEEERRNKFHKFNLFPSIS